MTIDEFLADLKTHASTFRWHMYPNLEWLRGVKEEPGELTWRYCPVTALAKAKLGERYPTVDFLTAGKALGLTSDDTTRIALAADGPIPDRDVELTKKLVEAIGLSSAPQA